MALSLLIHTIHTLIQDGDRFWKMPECYIRGNTVKYIRVPNEVRAGKSARSLSVRLHCLEPAPVTDSNPLRSS